MNPHTISFQTGRSLLPCWDDVEPGSDSDTIRLHLSVHDIQIEMHRDSRGRTLPAIREDEGDEYEGDEEGDEEADEEAEDGDVEGKGEVVLEGANTEVDDDVGIDDADELKGADEVDRVADVDNSEVSDPADTPPR